MTSLKSIAAELQCRRCHDVKNRLPVPRHELQRHDRNDDLRDRLQKVDHPLFQLRLTAHVRVHVRVILLVQVSVVRDDVRVRHLVYPRAQVVAVFEIVPGRNRIMAHLQADRQLGHRLQMRVFLR